MLWGSPHAGIPMGCFQASCWGFVSLRKGTFGCANAQGLRTTLHHHPLCLLCPAVAPRPLCPQLSVSLSPTTQLPATKPSSCKTFWKRCQGLLGNTWGSLKRKRKPPRQLVEEVMSPEKLHAGQSGCMA